MSHSLFSMAEEIFLTTIQRGSGVFELASNCIRHHFDTLVCTDTKAVFAIRALVNNLIKIMEALA